MWKKQKVKAGVLLYAVTMAAIFSLLLQFYLNRQVAHHKDFSLNKEKLAAFAMAKRSKDKAEQESGERAFNLGKVTYHNTKTGFATSVRMNKGNYGFLFPPMKTKEKKTDTEKQSLTNSSEQTNQKATKDKKDNS
ncbi:MULTISPECIES: competence type IV pilus minor pilin ComGG [Streptococcus]|uniref:Competence protein ComGF n=1 Tax=Streptococcus oralis subsp. dentisani TaxID=1458253 RepID=A0A1X1JEY0_STROR|nr:MULTISPECIES: competence type IV pilus minor pilin ComGG [Streptococcus]ORO85722.1 competence protein ComGF [Streptococcus oralis subsp. dentisani]